MGCVTGIGNVFPKSVARLYSLWQDGKIAEARQLQGPSFACGTSMQKGPRRNKVCNRILRCSSGRTICRSFVRSTETIPAGITRVAKGYDCYDTTFD